MRLKLEVNSLNKNVGNYKIKVRNSTIIEFILTMKENQQNNGGFFYCFSIFTNSYTWSIVFSVYRDFFKLVCRRYLYFLVFYSS